MFPDLSVFWVIFFVLVLTILLDRLLFRPLQGVMRQRAEATQSARELAERSATEARAATEEFERKTAAARAEIYRQMDEMRKTAMAERTEILTRTRAEAEAETPAAGSPPTPKRLAPRPRSASSGAARPDRIDPDTRVPE